MAENSKASSSHNSDSNNGDASKSSSKDGEKTQEKKTVQLSVLEEDDEFEEFPAQDWDDTATELAKLVSGQPGSAETLGDRLWEDNWDDDDIEEEFNLQLRNELGKTSGGDEGQAMHH